MAEKSVIIIGAGITGLAAGCYGQMNSYRTRIFELHDKPGGLCTSWNRQGYTIDGCMHWLVGSAPGEGFYPIWQELGAIQDRQIINQDIFMQVEGKDGRNFTFYTDLDRLEKHMLELAPEDKDAIRYFISQTRTCARDELPVNKAPELYGIADLGKLLRVFPYLRLMIRWSKVTIRQFTKRFKNPFLREVLNLVWYPEMSVFFLLMTFAWLHNKVAGYAIGGSLKFSQSIEKRYLGLGGEIKYKARVAKILVEDGRATGVKLEDGTEHRADYVISAADGYTTIFDMLEGKYIDDKIQGYYDGLPIFPPLVYASFGVNRSFSDVSRLISGLSFPVNPPATIAGKKIDRLAVHIYNFDPTLAPPGKTVVTVMIDSEYEYWRKLKQTPEQYRAEKEQIADTLVSLLDRRFPGFASQVEMKDIATPVTFQRYTGNWQGSFEGWMLTPQTGSLRMSKTLPGLSNFYMAGQWVEPGGGLPTAAFSARNVMQILCKKDKKKFTTTTP
jgi:phytoene dehydrogenase-like protein